MHRLLHGIKNLNSTCHSNSSTVPTTHYSGTVKANLTEPTKIIRISPDKPVAFTLLN